MESNTMNLYGSERAESRFNGLPPIELLPDEKTPDGFVPFREMVASLSGEACQAIVGDDAQGGMLVVDLDDTPHIVACGTIGGGQSMFLGGVVGSLLMRSSPSEVRLVLIDPKRCDFCFPTLPHECAPRPIDEREGVAAFRWAAQEANRRRLLFQEVGAKDYPSFREVICSAQKRSGGCFSPDLPGYLPRVVIMGDMLLLMKFAGSEMEQCISSLVGDGESTGIHLIATTHSSYGSERQKRWLSSVNCRIVLPERNEDEPPSYEGERPLSGGELLMIKGAADGSVVRGHLPYVMSPADLRLVATFWICQAETARWPGRVESLCEAIELERNGRIREQREADKTELLHALEERVDEDGYRREVIDALGLSRPFN